MKKIHWFFFLLTMEVLISCLTNNTINPKAQFSKDTTAIRTFLADSISAIKIPQGVWYSFKTEGLGIYPVLSDSINISYKAKLIPSLTEVDSSPGVTVLLSSVISGWQYGLLRFPVGSVGKLYIPSGLAFGETLYNKIHPNSNLLYEITLINIKGTRYTTDTTAINTYITTLTDSLTANNISLRRDASKIRYSYDQLYGTPVLYQSMRVTYTGRVLGAKTFFVNAVDTTLVLKNQSTAWKLIMPKITVGTKVTIYVPSGYGYGAFGTDKIPINSNLVYQVELKEVF